MIVKNTCGLKGRGSPHLTKENQGRSDAVLQFRKILSVRFFIGYSFHSIVWCKGGRSPRTFF
jgi:hypothetical protein